MGQFGCWSGDEIHCGSEPARDSGVSVDINADRSTAIASRLAPTGGMCWLIERGQLSTRFCGAPFAQAAMLSRVVMAIAASASWVRNAW
ncbi:hypothetical protein DZG01_17945 [Pseudomonas fluorescens]|nr:hypothetical protein DZG01_17945 [Pseudomonas fluorescens]